MSRFLGALCAVLAIGIEWLGNQDEAQSRQHYESLASSERMQQEAEYWRGEAKRLRSIATAQQGVIRQLAGAARGDEIIVGDDVEEAEWTEVDDA